MHRDLQRMIGAAWKVYVDESGANGQGITEQLSDGMAGVFETTQHQPSPRLVSFGSQRALPADEIDRG